MSVSRSLPVVLALSIVGLGLSACGARETKTVTEPRTSAPAAEPPAPPAPPPAYTEDSPEYQLAVIDDKATTPSDEDGIRPYARELDLVGRKCTERRSRLADYTVNTVQQAKKKNVSTNNLNVLRKVRASFPPTWKRQKCIGVFVLYLTLLTERG